MIEIGDPCLIQESHVDLDQDQVYYQTEMYEPRAGSIGELFRDLRSEFGRCTGKIHCDCKDGKVHDVGWLFQSRVTNDDGGSYLREVWITLYREVDHKARTRHYYYLDQPPCDSSHSPCAAKKPNAATSTSTSTSSTPVCC